MILLCFSCNSQQTDLIIYKENEVIPNLIVEGGISESVKDHFNNLFEKATGTVFEENRDSSERFITIRLKLSGRGNEGNFSIVAKKNTVTIEGTHLSDIINGINYFFREYAGFFYVSGKGIVGKEVKEIVVPKNLSYRQSTAFEYREPYFPDNYDLAFRQWYGTHAMEDIWGLWGHNIAKAVTSSPKMFSIVNGKTCEDQFCFTSPELENALVSYVKMQTEENPNYSKFMIQANDNNVVCLCDRCKAAGNTETNASPAVFSMLNKLAKQFPDKQFVSTAYITTQHAPKFKLENNAAIMISTMAFPKGIILEKSHKKEEIEKIFSEWKKVTKTIYLWDYAVNFDNYFKAYPTLLSTQANLKYFKRLGVKGVFMQGSEGEYSAFSDLKCYIYALLLSNPDIDVKEEIARFFKAKYSGLSDLLTDYYLAIESKSFSSKRALDIYGGMAESKRKYFEAEAFNNFYNALLKRTETLSDVENKDSKPLLLSQTFIKLELLRTDNNALVNTPEAKSLLNRLKDLSSYTGIKTYNEMGYLISDYFKEWDVEIINQPYANLAFGKDVKLLSKADDDYNNPSTLTDGAVGFSDYYNNWMLCTDEALSVSFNADDVRGAKTIEMDFLHDAKHNIYAPKKVEIIIGTRKYEADIKAVNNKLSKKHVKIAIEIEPSDKIIEVKTFKPEEYKNKSMACDEIFFKK